MMSAVLMTPFILMSSQPFFTPKISRKSNICKKSFHFATFRLVTPPKPPRRTTPTRSVERPKISTVLLPTYSNNVNTNNTNNTMSTTDNTNSMDQSSFTAVSSLSSSTFLVRYHPKKERFPIIIWIMIMIVRCVIPTRGETRC